MRPRPNDHQIPDDIFKCIFFNETVWIPIVSIHKCVPKGQINNIGSDNDLAPANDDQFTYAYMCHSAPMS